ncbi:ABC transporter substrate-binding protein, partial [Klebsiella pneumoniae]|uniref:ABC transporter substrate-binding protein n=1 Tax=Klebsiella pneumoniae TaxID=573 RepID=UPI0030134CDA
GTPELLKVIGPELLDGLLFSVADWPFKGDEALVERYKKRTGEPWMTQDGLTAYGDMWILKEAAERAGAADRVKLAEAIRT